MIIRRKPLGSEGIRKPRTLGLSLLREGIARVQSLSVQRQSTADEPIDWGEGVPEDVYTDYDAANQVNQVDSSVVDQGDYETAFTDALGRAEQPVPRPANEARRTARRRVQRQPAEPPPQVITPPPPPQPAAPSRPLRRQALSDGDTMPPDLQAIWELHKRLGHIREKPVVTRRPDGSPIPRKRAQIVEMPSKSSAEPELPRSASPIGAPLQRESNAPESISDSAVESPQPSFAEADPMLPTPPEPAQLSAGSDMPEAFDAEATLTDFRLDSAADVRRSPIPSAPVPSAPAAPPMIDDSASVPPGAAREFAPSPQFDGGDLDEADEEPDTAPAGVRRAADVSTNAVRRAAIESAIARFELPTLPGAVQSGTPDLSSEDAPDASNEGHSLAQGTEAYQPQTAQSQTPRRPSVQRTAQPDAAPALPISEPLTMPDEPQLDDQRGAAHRSENPDFASFSALEGTPDTPQAEPGVQRNAVRRSAIEAAIARAEQPANDPGDTFDTSEVSPDNPIETLSAQPTASIQRQVDTNSPIPPSQLDATATPKSAQSPAQNRTAASPSIQRHAGHTPSSDSFEEENSAAVQRTAIDAAVARAEQPAVPDSLESDAFFSDTPQATVTDRPGRTTTTSIQRQAIRPAASEPAVPEGESPQADFADSPSVSSKVSPSDAAAVRRAAIDAAMARAELPTAPDITDDVEAPTLAESGVLTPPRQTSPRQPPVQRQSTPPTPASPIQMPPNRESSGQPPSLQTPFAQAQPEQSAAAESESFDEPTIRTATTDRIDSVRRATNGEAILYEEPPAVDDTVEFEPFSPDQPDSANEHAPTPTAIQRHAEPAATLPDQTDSIRRAAIQAAIARAELPSAPDVEDSFAEPAPFDSAESVDYAEPDYADTDSTDSPETPTAPLRPTSVQRRAEQPRSTETSPDTTSSPPTNADQTASVRRAAIDAAIVRAEQPTETESSDSFDSAAPGITSPPRPSRPRRTTVQRHAAPDTPAQPDQPDQIDLPTAFTPRPAVQRTADESSAEAPETTARRSVAGRKAAIDAAIARAEQPAAPDEFESFASDAAQPPTMPASLPVVQRHPTELQAPTPPDRTESVRRAAIQSAIARAEQPTLPEADELETPSTPTPTGRRGSIALTTPPSAETRSAPARRQTVQRHAGHADSAAPELEDDSIQRTPTVRRSAIDAAIARAEQPAATPSFDFAEADADYLDVGDIYDVSTGDRANLPTSSPAIDRSETRTADAVRRSAESDTPSLNWPSTPRTPNRPARTERPADVSIQRTAELESASEQSESQSQASADEVQMLQMLGLPPNTPITRSSPSTPPIVRSAAPEAVQRIPVTAEIVQREQTASSNSLAANQGSAQQAANEVQQAEPFSNADVEQVAQAVYQSLRNRLRIERERSHGRVQ